MEITIGVIIVVLVLGGILYFLRGKSRKGEQGPRGGAGSVVKDGVRKRRN